MGRRQSVDQSAGRTHSDFHLRIREMGGRTLNRGVRAKGSDRIEFEFIYKGKRYRPSLARIPTEANLRRAAMQLRDIKLRIKFKTFSFKDEFPDYRLADPP